MSNKITLKRVFSTTKPFWTLLFKTIVIILAVVGIVDTATASMFMAGGVLLYFTIQSNIAIAFICFVFLLFDIISLFKKKTVEIPRWLYISKFLCTVAITLTFLVFWLILVPTFPRGMLGTYLKSLGNLCCHTFVPIFAILDWLFFDRGYRSKKNDYLWGTAMPLYYLLFSMIAGIAGADFGGGSKFPYFFLNYEKNGWLSLGRSGIGVIWWIIIVAAIVICISSILMWSKNKLYQKLLQKEMKLPVDEVVTEEYVDKKDGDDDK